MAYFKNNYSEFVEIVERAATPTAASGEAGNLRTTMVY
jgi:hypothetical protein